MLGRPPKAPKDRRNDVVNIPVTSLEKQAIRDAAEADGERFITWARETLLRAAKRRQK